MAIPRYDEIQFPALELLGDGKPWRSKEMEPILAKKMMLTEEEASTIYDSGSTKIFLDRLNWALSYLNMAGLVSKPKRGIYTINETGTEILKKPDEFRGFINEKMKARELEKKKEVKDETENYLTEETDKTPEEALYSSYEGIKESVYREILDTILSKTPREFEVLVVQLLQKMGYGGEIEDAGLVTQYVNDKGIDGIIKEDVLGFGKINIQAKRYKLDNKVPREDVQKFVGALAVAQTDKGVFITTSDFTKGAYEYVASLNASSKIVLINGNKLAKYMYDFNLGMQVVQRIEIKKLDSDYWDNMLDDE